MFFFYEHTLHKIPCQEKWQENVKKLSIRRHGILFSTHLCHVLLFWAVGYGRMPDRSIRDASTARKRHGAGKLRRRKGEEPDRERGRQAFGLRTIGNHPATVPALWVLNRKRMRRRARLGLGEKTRTKRARTPSRPLPALRRTSPDDIPPPRSVFRLCLRECLRAREEPPRRQRESSSGTRVRAVR